MQHQSTYEKMSAFALVKALTWIHYLEDANSSLVLIQKLEDLEVCDPKGLLMLLSTFLSFY